MCMCIEFGIQVLEQKNAHVSFPVGMVISGELGFYIVWDTPESRHLKVSGPRPTIKQLEEARKGNGLQACISFCIVSDKSGALLFLSCLHNMGNENCARTFLHKLFEHPQESGTSRQTSPDIPDSSLRPSRESTNSSATTPTRGRPPPQRAVSGPKKLISVLFFLA